MTLRLYWRPRLYELLRNAEIEKEDLRHVGIEVIVQRL